MTNWEQLGRVHGDGSRFVGLFLGPVEPYWMAGTPIVNKLVQATVDLGRVRDVDLGGVVDVLFDGAKLWHALRDGVRIGRLPWSLVTFEPKPWKDHSGARVDDGVLEVTRLLLDPSDVVINIGGIVRPR